MTEQLAEDTVIDLMNFDMDPEEEEKIKTLEEKTKYKEVALTWELNIEKYGYGAKRKAYDPDYEHVESSQTGNMKCWRARDIMIVSRILMIIERRILKHRDLVMSQASSPRATRSTQQVTTSSLPRSPKPTWLPRSSSQEAPWSY